MMNKTFRPAKAALAFGLAISTFSAVALPNRIAASATEALQLLGASSGGALTSALRANDAYAGVHALPGAVLVADGATLAPLARAQNFLASYGAIAGVSNPVSQLVLKRLSTDRAGITHVHLDQVQAGLPVFGARLVVHMTEQGIVGVNGVFIPGLESISTAPAKDIAFLRERALVAAHKLHPTVGNLSVDTTRLMFYRTGLLKSVEGHDYLAYEVVVKGGNAAFPVRERIILNANTGNVLNRINGIHSLLNREIYTPNQDVPPVLTEGSPLAPADPALVKDDRNAASTRTADTPVNNLYVFAGGTYALYKNLFGREGYDDGALAPEEQVQKSVYLVNDQCPNAYWNGDSTNYCPGFDGDDVVSHEWSHAYTEYTHGLVYQYQSGALNESYSDIFGEVYDLTNGIEGPLGATLTEGDYYENGGSRWFVGEDLSEQAALLILRDMWDPDSFPVSPIGYPYAGRTISDRYFCGTADGGGVHINSAVPNHAFAMLVDGKTYNGVEIPAIGMTKAAHIYFQAETQYQTPTTNFTAHADALEQSCRDLIGRPLNDVLGAPSTEVITASDCSAVSKAIAAVEFRSSVREQCAYVNVLKAESTTPALCPTGEFVFPTFQETWEGGAIPTGWTQTINVTGDFTSPTFNYSISSDLPAPHTGKALFARNDGDGTCAPGGDASGSLQMDTPEITVPETASFFSFTHLMQSEAGFDGGNLKYSIDGAAFAIVPAAAFKYNEHSGEFGAGPLIPGVPDPVGLGGNNTSPLAGEVAWTGADQGEATGSWGTTVVDLAALGAAKGQKVKFRYEFGQDGCGGNLGWFIDDTQAFYCSKTAPVTPGPGPGPGPTPTPVTPPGDGTTVGEGRFGGGALGLMALLPLAGMALRRRRRAH